MQRFVITAIALALSVATPSFAEPREQIHVAVSPSDLSSDQAVGALYQRIVQAADAVCAPGLRTFPSTQSTCRTAALNDAIARANIRELTAFHRQAHVNAQIASR